MAQTLKTVVITGVSTGIGKSLVARFIKDGWQVLGSVRKAVDAEALKTEFGAQFQPLLFDVTDNLAIEAAARQVREILGGRKLDCLINNAGIAVTGPLAHLPTDKLRRQARQDHQSKLGRG